MEKWRINTNNLFFALLGALLLAVLYGLSGLPAEASTIGPAPCVFSARDNGHVPVLPIISYWSIDATQELTYTISGQVIDRFGEPLADTLLTAGGRLQTLSDADGLYTFGGMPEGTYEVVPSRVGYTFAPASHSVSVPPDAQGHNFTGTLPSISGYVVTLEGLPISNVEVSTNGGHTGMTGPDGSYEITDVYSGTYVLTPQKIGFTFAPQSTLVSVPPDAKGRNFTGTLASRINGRLTFKNTGLPMGHRIIRAVRNWDGTQADVSEDLPAFSVEYTTTTDIDGNYSFDAVLEGSYTFYPGEIGYTFGPETHSVSVPPNADGHNFTATFEVHLPVIMNNK